MSGIPTSGGAGDVTLAGNPNAFTGTNTYDVNRPTSDLANTPAATEFITKQDGEDLFTNNTGDALLAAGDITTPQDFTGVNEFSGGNLLMTKTDIQNFQMIQTDINASVVNSFIMTGKNNRIQQTGTSNGVLNEFKQSGGVGMTSNISQLTTEALIYQDSVTAKYITKGRIGIGMLATQTPGAPLTVMSQSGVISSNSWRVFNFGTGFITGTAQWNNMGIYCRHTIMGGSWVGSHAGTLASSDKRIKEDIEDIPTGEAISLMRKLKPRKYKYIDKRYEPYEVAGFIADEVIEVLPQGVKLFRQPVPNIYKFAHLNDDIITFGDDYKVEKLSVDIPIQLYNINEVPVEVNILKIDTSNNNIQISNTNDTLKDFTDINKIFVYGEVVEDFKTLKHEYLNTIMFQSVKEIDTEQQADKIKIKALEDRLAILEDKINNM